MRRLRETKRSYRQSSIFPNWHRFHIEGPQTPRTDCSTVKLVALSHVAQHPIEDPIGCVYPCIVCTYRHTLTHTVASPKENKSFFFFFFCRKIPPLFTFSFPKAILLTLKSWCPHTVLWTYALICASAVLGGTAAGAGGALRAADAVCCTAVLRGWRGCRDLLPSCGFSWGKGETKSGVGRREIENVSCHEKQFSIPAQSSSSGGLYCHAMNILGHNPQSTAENATRLWHLGIAHEENNTAVFLSILKAADKNCQDRHCLSLLSALTQMGPVTWLWPLYSFAVSWKKANEM